MDASHLTQHNLQGKVGNIWDTKRWWMDTSGSALQVQHNTVKWKQSRWKWFFRTPTKIYIDWISWSTTNRIQKMSWLILTTSTMSKQRSSIRFRSDWSVLDRMVYCSYRSMSQDTIFRSSRQIGRSCNLSNNLLSSPNVYYSGYTGCEWQGNRCKVNDDGSNGAL